MADKFKIGDQVVVSRLAIKEDWYHTRPMKIIGKNNQNEYFTDEWGKSDPVSSSFLELDSKSRKLKMKRICEDYDLEDDLNKFMVWLTDVWNPNQLYIPFQSDAAQAYIKYKDEQKKNNL